MPSGNPRLFCFFPEILPQRKPGMGVNYKLKKLKLVKITQPLCMNSVKRANFAFLRISAFFDVCFGSILVNMNRLAAVTLPARTSSDILRRMVGLVRRTASDVAPWALTPLEEFFRMVSLGHYNREPDEWRAQVLARPAATISKAVPVIACANKAIIVASWAQLNGIPWRLVAVSRVRGRPPHHVFPELFVGGEWRPVDATYPWSVLFARKFYPVRIIATGMEVPA